VGALVLLRRLARVKGVRRIVLPVARRVLRSGVVRSGPAAGLRLDTDGTNPGYLLGASEPQVQEALVRLLGAGDVVYDVGANVGFLTLLAARRVGPAGAVYAFEPHPRAAEVLRANVRANSFANVHVVEAAVGRTTGRVRIRADDHLTARLGDAGFDVSQIALDHVDAAAPTLVKIDVEGAEVDVLEGASRVLAEARPVVICELHGGTEEACASLLAAAGYDVSRLEDAEGGMPHLIAMPQGLAATAASP
jgi:FkbM family methyltransferase